MIQNILDSNNNIIGTLEVPDSTSQDQINSLLSLYSYTPSSPSTTSIVSSAIQSAINFGQDLLIQYSTQNVLAGITQANQSQNVANYLNTLNYYLNTGSLYSAINEINTLIADTSSTKASLSPYVTNDILYSYLNEIQNYLGIPLTANPGS